MPVGAVDTWFATPYYARHLGTGGRPITDFSNELVKARTILPFAPSDNQPRRSPRNGNARGFCACGRMSAANLTARNLRACHVCCKTGKKPECQLFNS